MDEQRLRKLAGLNEFLLTEARKPKTHHQLIKALDGVISDIDGAKLNTTQIRTLQNMTRELQRKLFDHAGNFSGPGRF